MVIHNGYHVVDRGGKRKKVHRLLMEEQLGRKLEPWEIVHHIDGNRLNNSLDNLQLVTPEDHAGLHAGPRRGK